MTKTPFRQRPARERLLIIGLILLSLAVVATAQRDLHRRSDGQVRGSKTVWRLLSLNALGALIYLRWGRAPSNE